MEVTTGVPKAAIQPANDHLPDVMVTTGANPTVVASEEDRVTGQLSKEKKKEEWKEKQPRS